MHPEILYENKQFVLCVKPVGVLSQADENTSENMVTLLHLLCDSPIYPIHRLDRQVGGIIVYAKTKEMAAKLSTEIQNHRFIKEYYAVIHGHLEEKKGIFSDWLFKDSKQNKVFSVKRPRKGAKEAILEYEVLSEIESFSLVKIQLKTGRTHQVRVQFASRKHPLVGDGKYGSHDNHCEVALWSHRLCFFNGSEAIDRECSPPNAYPWNLF